MIMYNYENNVSAYNIDKLPSPSCILETVHSPPQRHRVSWIFTVLVIFPQAKFIKFAKKKEYMCLDSNKISETFFSVGFACWDFIYQLAETVSCKQRPYFCSVNW